MDAELDTTTDESPPKEAAQPYIPHLISSDHVTIPGTPTTFGHHRRMSSNGSSIMSPGSPVMPNFSLMVISVKEIENEHLPNKSPVRRLHHTRYSRVLGNVENNKPVRKLLRRSRRSWHRRDSFASLPRLSDIGIAKEDLVVRELRQPFTWST
jgi:hypothetical protein